VALLGTHRLLDARWVGTNAIAVRFEANDDGLLRQLYAGRTMIGVTAHPSDREVVGQLVQSEYPQLLSLVAVESANKITDYGDTFGHGPWNRAKITVSVSSLPADAARLEITAGTEPGGAVDPENVLGNIILEGDGTYSFLTESLPGSGDWNFAVTPYDSRGNAGTPLEPTIELLSMPPDVVLQDDETRLFDASIESQTLNVSVVLP
jgi:hypothetical protein